MIHVINASDASICLCVCDASVYPLPDLSPASQDPEAHPRPPPPLPPPLLLSLQPSFLLPSRLGDVLGAFYSSPRLLSLHSVTPSHRPSPLPPLIVSSQLLLSSHSPRKMIFFFLFFFLHWEMFPRKKVAPQLDEDAWLDTRLRSSSVFFFFGLFLRVFSFSFCAVGDVEGARDCVVVCVFRKWGGRVLELWTQRCNSWISSPPVPPRSAAGEFSSSPLNFSNRQTDGRTDGWRLASGNNTHMCHYKVLSPLETLR